MTLQEWLDSKDMVDFYQRILNREPRADALHAAQNDLRRNYSEPYYWERSTAWATPGRSGSLPARHENRRCLSAVNR